MKLFVSIPKNSDVFRTFIAENVQKYLEERFEVHYSSSEKHLSVEEFKTEVKDAEAVITGWGHFCFTPEILSGTKIKYIVHTGGSVGSLVTPEIYDMGMKVISGNMLYAESVAEGTLAYMMTGLRRIPHYVDQVRNGGWMEGWDTEGLFDRTVGIVSLGAISRILIDMLQMFRVKIKIYSGHQIDEDYLKSINAEQVSLEEIFSTCDIVSVHSAMNEKTRHMIKKEHFDMLRDGALFINTARGHVIEEQEMIEALKENRFKAVLDVYWEEPLAKDSPLRSLKNVFPLPHQGGPTLDRRPFITMRIADAIFEVEQNGSSKLEISKSAAARMTVGG